MTAKTEEQARTKWCPHVRTTDENMGTFNRWNLFEPHDPRTPSGSWKDTGQLNPGCLCIASDCMMWDWKGLQRDDGSHVISGQAAGEVRCWNLSPGDVGVGDCGLKR